MKRICTVDREKIQQAIIGTETLQDEGTNNLDNLIYANDCYMTARGRLDILRDLGHLSSSERVSLYTKQIKLGDKIMELHTEKEKAL